MTINFLTRITKRTALALGLGLGASVLVGAPALADQHTDSYEGSGQSSEMQQMEQSDSAAMNIVDVASGSDSFNTLVQAVQAAGLADTLSGEGPYTVFAPTDEAFSQLPEGALDYLLQPENQDILRQVLTYHVIQGEVTSSEVSTGSVDALGGGLSLRVDGDRVIVNNASVVNPDIQASNGVIHAVNRVLLPETLRNTLASRLGVQSIY
ncbi:MAG: fasciclin domain-containing protein [Elainellaceae cyanobacterium]